MLSSMLVWNAKVTTKGGKTVLRTTTTSSNSVSWAAKPVSRWRLYWNRAAIRSSTFWSALKCRRCRKMSRLSSQSGCRSVFNFRSSTMLNLTSHDQFKGCDSYTRQIMARRSTSSAETISHRTLALKVAEDVMKAIVSLHIRP